MKLKFIFLFLFAIIGGWAAKKMLTPKKTVTAQTSQSEGVIFRDPLRASSDNFYNVVNGGHILDNQARSVFKFPHLLAHFYKDGSVLNADENGIQYFDSSAANVWSRDESVHHDMYVSDDESEAFFLAHLHRDDPKRVDDRVLGFDRQGKQIFFWSLNEHRRELEEIFGEPLRIAKIADREYEYMHLNSVQVIPPNPLEKENTAFKAGNILINCFTTALALIIDRETGRIVWHYSFFSRLRNYDHLSLGVHTIKMLDSGEMLYLRNVVYFYKRWDDQDKFSTLERLDPLHKKVVWHYVASPPNSFFTYEQGVVERLDNGHLLVTDSVHRTAFELDSHNNVVWEWRTFPDPSIRLFRVSRIAKSRLDPIINVWKAVK